MSRAAACRRRCLTEAQCRVSWGSCGRSVWLGRQRICVCRSLTSQALWHILGCALPGAQLQRGRADGLAPQVTVQKRLKYNARGRGRGLIVRRIQYGQSAIPDGDGRKSPTLKSWPKGERAISALRATPPGYKRMPQKFIHSIAVSVSV